jgi:hypothetical protein
MSSFTDYLETAALNWAFSSNAVTRPTAWFVALFTAAPGETGGGTEISTSGTAYVRKSAAFTISGNLATNSAAIEWDVAASSWGTVTHIAVFDASTGGNMLAYAPLTASKTIASGDVFRIPAGDLDITLT